MLLTDVLVVLANVGETVAVVNVNVDVSVDSDAVGKSVATSDTDGTKKRMKREKEIGKKFFKIFFLGCDLFPRKKDFFVPRQI